VTIVALPPPEAAPPDQRQLITPEGVDLKLRIGSASDRAAAFILDAMFMIGALIALTILSLSALGLVGLLGLASHKASLAAGSMLAVIWLLGFFLIRNGYFIAFELGFRAATPGKRIMGVRVASRDGGRLTADAVFVRNAMREIEIFLPLTFIFASGAGAVDPIGCALALLGLAWTGGFALFPLFNRDRLRVGDLVAGSWVVKAPRSALSIDILDTAEAVAFRFAFSTEQASAYGVKELHVLEDVLRRKDRRTMAAVAERIRTKIDWRAAADESDSAFLHAYYRALRGRLETRLLFGRRRKDKFDLP
jgi:uncharacterized RDD family membrane protein YckC